MTKAEPPETVDPFESTDVGAEPAPPNPVTMSDAAFVAHMQQSLGYAPEAQYADEPPTTLCQAGPCRNYFRAVALQDIQGNLDGSPVAPLLGVMTACYPTPGVEIDDLPETVFTCTRHDPVDLLGVSEIKHALAAWRERQRST